MGQITVREVGDVYVLDLVGRFTLGQNANDIMAQVNEFVYGQNKPAFGHSRPVKILMNLTECEYLDATGIGNLVSTFTTVTTTQGQFGLFGAKGRVLNLLRFIVSLAPVFEDSDDPDTNIEVQDEAVALRRFVQVSA